MAADSLPVLPHNLDAEREVLKDRTISVEQPWAMAAAEQRLLDFVAALILEVARSHPRVTQEQIALWLARVAVGAKR